MKQQFVECFKKHNELTEMEAKTWQEHDLAELLDEILDAAYEAKAECNISHTQLNIYLSHDRYRDDIVSKHIVTFFVDEKEEIEHISVDVSNYKTGVNLYLSSGNKSLLDVLKCFDDNYIGFIDIFRKTKDKWRIKYEPSNEKGRADDITIVAREDIDE
jgi:hypothetical protein